MKKIISFLLIIVMILCLVGCNEGKEKEDISTAAIAGKISYIKLREFWAEYPDNHSYLIYITPVGYEASGLWIPFTVSNKTETASEYSTDINKMPELALGSMVQIRYNTKEMYEYDGYMFGYEAISLTKADENYDGEVTIPFSKSEDYVFTTLSDYATDRSNVVNVAKMDGGYIIYLDFSRHVRALALTMYWVDNESIMDDKTRYALDSRQSNFTIEARIASIFPFDNFSMRTAYSIWIYEQEK